MRMRKAARLVVNCEKQGRSEKRFSSMTHLRNVYLSASNASCASVASLNCGIRARHSASHDA